MTYQEFKNKYSFSTGKYIINFYNKAKNELFNFFFDIFYQNAPYISVEELLDKNQMEALYHKFYKNQMTMAEYFNFILKSISDKDFTSSDLFKKYIKLYPNDSGPLLFFHYLYSEHKELFSDWKYYLAKLKDI